MKKTKLITLLIIIFSFVTSCTDDEPAFPEPGKYSGIYRIYLLRSPYQEPHPYCKPTTHSLNDLEIDPHGRLKRKIYKKNANGECVLYEILEGEIEITGAFYGRPFGTIRYDNSDLETSISLDLNEDGFHYKLNLQDNNDSIYIPQYTYKRTD